MTSGSFTRAKERDRRQKGRTRTVSSLLPSRLPRSAETDTPRRLPSDRGLPAGCPCVETESPPRTAARIAAAVSTATQMRLDVMILLSHPLVGGCWRWLLQGGFRRVTAGPREMSARPPNASGSVSRHMEFRILGPLEVWDGDRPVAVTERGSARCWRCSSFTPITSCRAIASSTSSGERRGRRAARPPCGFASPSCASRFGMSSCNRGSATSFGAERTILDLDRLDRLCEKGGSCRSPAQSPGGVRASPAGTRALARPALADFAYERFAQPAIARLEELRRGAFELRVDADLALGRHDELVGELESLVAEHPLRERVRGQLMLALYHPAGRRRPSSCTGKRAPRWSRSSASSLARHFRSSSRPSCARIRVWTSAARPGPERRSHRRRPARFWLPSSSRASSTAC